MAYAQLHGDGVHDVFVRCRMPMTTSCTHFPNAAGLTAHRCHGMTLRQHTIRQHTIRQHTILHVGDTFANGIVYVTLSRVTDMTGPTWGASCTTTLPPVVPHSITLAGSGLILPAASKTRNDQAATCHAVRHGGVLCCGVYAHSCCEPGDMANPEHGGRSWQHVMPPTGSPLPQYRGSKALHSCTATML